MSNLPKQTNDSQQPVREFFDNYFNENLTFPGAEVDAVVGYFESRGFDRTSSISTASVILKQAKIDTINQIKKEATEIAIETVKKVIIENSFRF